MSSASVTITDLEFRRRARSGHGDSFELRIDRFSVGRGERVAISGPSGCGKTTLLDLIAGLLVPEHGRVEVEGVALEGLSDRARRAHRLRTIGFVFQDFPLIEGLEVIENVLLPFRLHPEVPLERSARERALRLLDSLELLDRARRRPRELSQGERQRVALARALVTEPRLLLADEPTAGLDPAQSARVLDQLEAEVERRGLTLVTVSHDPAVLRRFGAAIELAHGRIVARRESHP